MAELQVTTRPVDINTGVSQKTSRFLKDITQISKGFESSLQGLQQISQQNTQRELANIATEKRVEAEARQELNARLAIQRREEAERKAAEREAKANAKAAEAERKALEKERLKALKEQRAAEADKAVNTFLIEQLSGRDISNTGNKISQYASEGNEDAAKGLTSAAISKAKAQSELMISNDLSQLDDTNAFDYDSRGNYTKYFSEALQGLGVSEDMLETYGSNEDLAKTVSSQDSSINDHFDDLKKRKEEQIVNAVNSTLSIANFDALTEFEQGNDSALGNMLSKIEKAEFTYGQQLGRDKQANAAVKFLGTAQEYMTADSTLTKEQALSRFDSIVSKANTSKASVMNRPEVQESVAIMRRQIGKAKEVKTANLNLEENRSKTLVNNSKTLSESVERTAGYIGAAPSNGVMYTSKELENYVNSGVISESYAKSVQAKQNKLFDDETQEAVLMNQTSKWMQQGKSIPTSYRGRTITQDMKDKNADLIVFSGGEGVNPVDQAVGLYRTSYRHEPFTKQMKAAFSVNTQSPETLKQTYMVVRELKETGEDIYKYKLPQATRDLFEQADEFIRRNPDAFLNTEDLKPWDNLRDTILGGNEFIRNNKDQESVFKNSSEVKEANSNIFKSTAYDASVFSTRFDMDYSEVQNRTLVNKLLDDAGTQFFKTNRGNPEGYEEFAESYMKSKIVVDPETKFAFPINSSFSNADEQASAYDASEFTKRLFGNDTPVRYNGVEEYRFIPYSADDRKLVAAYRDSSGQWIEVLNDSGSPITVKPDFIIENYTTYVRPTR